jgi:hypothetical protein
MPGAGKTGKTPGKADNSAGLKSVSKPNWRWRVGNITLSGRVTSGLTFWIRNGGHLGFNAMRESAADPR